MASRPGLRILESLSRDRPGLECAWQRLNHRDPAMTHHPRAGKGLAPSHRRARVRPDPRETEMTTDAARPDPDRWKALAVLSIAYLMVVLDVSIVNVALPSIQTDLGFSPEDLQWVVSGYALTFGGFLLLGGRARRPAGPAQPLHDRPGRLRRLLGDVRALASTDGMLIVGAPAAGRRLGAARAVGVLDHDGDLPGGRRAQQGAGHPRRDRGRGRGDRRAPGRRAHRVRGLGVGLLDQRADRPAHAAGRPPLRAREQGRGHRAQLRRLRRRQR